LSRIIHLFFHFKGLRKKTGVTISIPAMKEYRSLNALKKLGI